MSEPQDNYGPIYGAPPPPPQKPTRRGVSLGCVVLVIIVLAVLVSGLWLWNVWNDSGTSALQVSVTAADPAELLMSPRSPTSGLL